MQYNENRTNLEACRSYMAECGLPFDGEFIADGKIRRYSIDAKRSKRNEWYVGHEGISSKGRVFLVVKFGSWSDGGKYVYNSFENSNFNDEEKQSLRKLLCIKNEEMDKAFSLEHAKAAAKAKELWEECKTSSPSQEYLRYPQSKKIDPVGGVRFGLYFEKYPAIVVPVKNFDGEIRSLQFIFFADDGACSKRFLFGGEKRGNFHVIGEIFNFTTNIYIAEGYATAVTVHQATNKPVIIAFDSGNVLSVVENFTKKYPRVKIIIAADCDDVGKQKAFNAAKEFGCCVIIPSFPSGFVSKENTDFNDLYQLCGIEEVQKQLKEGVFAIKESIVVPNYLIDKKEPCKDFTISTLPIPLREYIAALCKTTNAHPIMLTSSVLTMVSATLGTKVFMPNGTYYQDLYLNLWILCIAKSGQYKTTALNKGSRIANDRQSKVFKDIKEIKMQCEASGDKPSDVVLKKSLENVILPTKLTAEAFLEHLGQGHYGAIYASEFGGWLQNLDKTHNNDFKAILTEFYDVPCFYRYKTKTQGDCIIERPYISICGVSTMPWIRSNLKPSDVPSGFFARFLLFVPPYQEGTCSAFPVPVEKAYVEAEDRFKEYMDIISQNVGESRPMYPTDEARVLIQKYHDDILALPKQHGDKAEEILQPYIKRWSPTLIKLSMLMQLFIDPETDQVGDIAVMSAMSILTIAMKSTAMLFEGELGESSHQRKCRIMLELISRKTQEAGRSVLRQEILQSNKFDGGSEEYDYVLKTLIEEGKVDCVQHKKKKDWEYVLLEKVE